MSEATVPQDTPVSQAVLQRALATVLNDYFGVARHIVQWQQAPSPYRSSFTLDELTVTLDDGLTFAVVFKDVGRCALSAAGQRAKPAFLYHPQREIATYRHILSTHLPSAPHYYGAVVDEAQARYWLFLEKVVGAALSEVALPTWQEVARWLAAMHTHFAQQTDLSYLAETCYLLRYDRAFYWVWPRRAQRFLQQMEPALPARTLAQFAQLVAGYAPVVERLLTLPITLIHGEFYAANVLVQETTAGLRVCPVDWEMAALGPGLIDLAALVAGGWSEAEKRELALAYYREVTLAAHAPPTFTEFLHLLDCCRLHVACQWLGWSAQWTAPAHQAQDWLDEALRVAERVVNNS